jgi:HPt (histidine-containing phosphotransfer) domain-containing protein
MPIVAMTAHAFEEDRRRCEAAGMDDHLAKPVSTEALSEKLDRWLPARAPISPAKSDIPVFDHANLLERMMGDGQLSRAIVLRYLETTPTRLSNFKAALEAGDSAEAARLAHLLFGASSNVGAARFGGILKRMEGASKAGELETVKAEWGGLLVEHQRLEEHMSAWARNAPGAV